jgi:hypothetical protein
VIGAGKSRDMHTRLPEPQVSVSKPGSRIASYADLRGAALAVRHLRRCGFDGRVHVRPTAAAPLEGTFVTVPTDPRRSVGVLTGGAVLASILALAGASVGAAVVGLPAAAVVGGLAYSADDAMLRLRRRRAHRAASLARVGRWDVVCQDEPEAAEHELARWWDPEALPAPVAREERKRRLRVVAVA